MPVSINDKLRKYKSLFSTTLSTGISTGTSDTITPASVSGLPTDTPITLTFDRVDSGGVATPTKLERIRGIISGGNFTAYVRGKDGTTEQAHTAGAVIEMIWNADDLNDMVDWGVVQHNQDGTHGAITATNASFVTPMITNARMVTGINDTNGNEVIKTPATTSAVNEVTVTNAATGGVVEVSATGGDTDIGLTLASKGTDLIKLKSGSTTTLGHSVPNIADDTVALLAAAQALTNKTITSHLAYADARYKVGTFTRAQTGTAGDVGYTGVGFQPTAIIFFMSPGTTDMSYYSSWGFSNATVNYCTVVRAAVNSVVATSCIFTGNGSADQKAIVKTFDADGFTLTWSTTGSPATANMTIFYLALR